MSHKPPPSDDVRMRGFLGRSRVQEAWEWIDREIQSLPNETVSLSAAYGRVLAEDVTASIDVPAFDRSAMDGFALRGSETTGAGDYQPLPFRIIGVSTPGKPASQTVVPGTCVRIMTGAPLPAGADAVLPAEYTRETGAVMEAVGGVPAGKNVGRIGEDIRHGARLLAEGTQLRPQDVAVLASVGIPDVAVVRQPRVRILITGNELVSPGQERETYQIYDANSYLLRALCQRDGAESIEVRMLPDDREQLQQALMEPDADVILISGGTSVGSEDFAPLLIRELGELNFHGMAMRPSSPAGMGRIGSTWVISASRQSGFLPVCI
ncbi:MAG: molybdopterin molybdotransferase MoeA [Planctomycetales bacterium]